MTDQFELRDIPLTSKYYSRMAEHFLATRGLTLSRLDYMAGLFDPDGNLCACGGTDGTLIKCLAVSPDCQGYNLAGRLVSHLAGRIMDAGSPLISLYTKPENESLFTAMGFHIIGRAPEAIMMQNSLTQLKKFVSGLEALRRPGSNGAIVMNANPLTQGHLHLIKTAASQCDTLYIVLLHDDTESGFTYKQRHEAVCHAVSGMTNVVVTHGSDYAISRSTFPDYFIKDVTRVSKAYAAVDLDIFKTHIAPALGVTVRFSGTEPTDPLTALYLEEMQSVLPGSGIEVRVIDRLADETGRPYSASRLRQALSNGNYAEALKIAAPASRPLILAHAATSAIRAELDTTPKPGLVDRHDSGSHTDMDYNLMSRSIDSLYDYFVMMARSCQAQPDAKTLQHIGVEAESAMLKATDGVNTHRGAIFSLGLAVAAAAYLYERDGVVEPDSLQKTIVKLAQGIIPAAKSSHGTEVVRKHGVPGALEEARQGYPMLFSSWLPMYCGIADRAEANKKVLLSIISTLEDTNIYHRAGADGAKFAARAAAETMADYSDEAMSHLNALFIERGISPGGAADMLALTLFIFSITKPTTKYQ